MSPSPAPLTRIISLSGSLSLTLLRHRMRGDITRSDDETVGGTPFALAVLLDGLIPAVRALRRERPSVPRWNRYVSGGDAVALSARL